MILISNVPSLSVIFNKKSASVLPYTFMATTPQTHKTSNISPNTTSNFQPPLIASSSSSSSSSPPPLLVSQQFFKLNDAKLFAMTPVDVLHNFHKTFSSKCVEFFHAFIAHNPLFDKLLSVSAQFQVQGRTHRSMISLSSHNFAAVLPGDSVAGIVVGNGILNFLNIYNTVLIVRLVLTWFPNTPPQIVSPLSTICDPYLNIFRGIIPPLGGTLDLSPILAFLVLNAFTSAATALPAELPSPGTSYEGSTLPGISDLTTSQQQWRRRLQGSRAGNSNGAN